MHLHTYVSPLYTYIQLTLTALSLLFKFLPVSNTGDSIIYILATVHFLYPKLGSFFDMKHYFYPFAFRDSKVPKRFVGLNQMQCSPYFDWNWGKQMYQLHLRFQVLQQGKCLRYPPEHVSGVTETTICKGAVPPSNPHQRGTPHLKFPPYSLFRPKGG